MKAQSNCKWTTLAAIGREILEDEDGVSNHDGLLEYIHNMRLQQRCYLTSSPKILLSTLLISIFLLSN